MTTCMTTVGYLSIEITHLNTLLLVLALLIKQSLH
jgi:hypothetical protein